MSALLDLVGAKLQTGVKVGDDDTEMAIFIQAAVDMVENIVGPVDPRPNQVRSLVPFDVNAQYQGVGSALTGPWLLDLFPVISLDALTVQGAAYPVTVLQVQKHSGILTSTSPLIGPVQLTFTVGRSGPPPAAMQLATRIIFAHLWATQRGTSGRGRYGQGAEEGAVMGMGYAIPNRAADLLRPYELPPALA